MDGSETVHLLRVSMVSLNPHIHSNPLGMDLTMRFGGDDTCFLFNLTQNLRFDTIKVSNVSASGVDIPVYT
jgi:hypothetical protein